MCIRDSCRVLKHTNNSIFLYLVDWSLWRRNMCNVNQCSTLWPFGTFFNEISHCNRNCKQQFNQASNRKYNCNAHFNAPFNAQCNWLSQSKWLRLILYLPMLFVKQRCIPHLMSALLPIFKCPSNAQSKPILPILWPVSARHLATDGATSLLPVHGFRWDDEVDRRKSHT